MNFLITRNQTFKTKVPCTYILLLTFPFLLLTFKSISLSVSRETPSPHLHKIATAPHLSSAHLCLLSPPVLSLAPSRRAGSEQCAGAEAKAAMGPQLVPLQCSLGVMAEPCCPAGSPGDGCLRLPSNGCAQLRC